MSKLAAQDKFWDFSDYGRPLARLFANLLLHTKYTPVHVTWLFGLSGLLAICSILSGYYCTAGLFLVLKSIIDAADGELARLKNTPSYVGRYLDSVFDIVLNFLFLISICWATNGSWWLTLVAFVAVQLQGTLYNYYYVILRLKSEGADKTSKIFEHQSPMAFPGESQEDVDQLFFLFSLLYGRFDKAIHWLDKEAHLVITLPSWFMTMISVYGLGFQLLIMAVMLALHLIDYIVPFFIGYSVLLFFFVGIRRTFGPPTQNTIG